MILSSKDKKLGCIDKNTDSDLVTKFIDLIVTANIQLGISSIEFRAKLIPELDIVIKGIRNK